MFVGAQNWQGINYENTKKCLTGSKVAHVRLMHLMHSQLRVKNWSYITCPSMPHPWADRLSCFWHITQCAVCANREKPTLYHAVMFSTKKWPPSLKRQVQQRVNAVITYKAFRSNPSASTCCCKLQRHWEKTEQHHIVEPLLNVPE